MVVDDALMIEFEDWGCGAYLGNARILLEVTFHSVALNRHLACLGNEGISLSLFIFYQGALVVIPEVGVDGLSRYGEFLRVKHG